MNRKFVLVDGNALYISFFLYNYTIVMIIEYNAIVYSIKRD